MTFLELNGFSTNTQQCKVFIENYDHDNDGTMQYSEYNNPNIYRFLRAVLPLTDADLR
jgi:hypothetical protein